MYNMYNIYIHIYIHYICDDNHTILLVDTDPSVVSLVKTSIENGRVEPTFNLFIVICLLIVEWREPFHNQPVGKGHLCQ